MWKKLVERHRAWEEQTMRLLDNPANAADLPPGLIREAHLRAADTMSDVERQQMRNFMYKYRGWRSYAWIAAGLIVCSALGYLASMFFPEKTLFKHLLLANAIGLTTAFAGFIAWFNYRTLARKPLRFALRIVVVTALGLFASEAISGIYQGHGLDQIIAAQSGLRYLTVMCAVLFLMATVGVISMVRNQEFHAITARMQLDAERERSARLASESQLRLLRAQIEPHFLFNTLGAVQQLAEEGAPRAAELTANLIAFLRASLDGMRRDRVTLGEDFQMVEAYLQVMQVRMGQRLRYTLALPAALAGREVPSMMLLTLAENAIKHGIEPSLRGGEVVLSAAEHAGMLHLSVRDSGAGLSEQIGNGDGLANIRQRLDLSYRGAARFALAENADGGVSADIYLPLERKAA